jgi:hypothetical protein
MLSTIYLFRPRAKKYQVTPMPRRVEPHDRAPLLSGHNDDDEEDGLTTTTGAMTTRSRVFGPSRTTDDSEDEDIRSGVVSAENNPRGDHIRSCMGDTMSLCGRSLLAVWHVSRLPFDTMLNMVWHGNADGADPTTPTPSHADVNSGDDAPTSSRHHRSQAALSTTPVRIPSPGRVDERNSPLYKDFHPGKGYEALAAGAAREPSATSTTTTTTTTNGSSTRTLFPGTDVHRNDATPSAPSGTSPPPPSIPIPEADHSKIYTPRELLKRIDAIQAWLPVSKVKVDTPASAALADSPPNSMVPLSVTIAGPLRRPLSVPLSLLDAEACASIPSLGDVEDFILEDLSNEYRVRHINITDINFLATSFEADGHGGGRQTAMMMSSPSALRVEDDDDAACGEPYEVHKARVVGMIHNLINSVVECQGDPWPLRLVFTRCSFAPLDLLDTLRLPGGGFVEVLAFDRCPLADAHISSLLRRARQDDALFGHLRSLRLCGTLSSDAMRALLRYIDEEVEEPVLCELVVPNSCADVVGGHPIAMRLPRLMVNGKSIESYQPRRSRVSSLAM